MAATVVIDFETTGLGPAQGARATEVAAVRIEDGRITARYQSLMRSGVRVPPFIEQLTGISNRMLETAPPAAQVMHEATAFARGALMVAHNAAFDRAFWQHEAGLAGCAEQAQSPFACTMRLARRLYPEAPNHRLGTLAELHGLAATGRAHRALADAEMAAQLWLRIVRDVERRYATAATHELLCALQAAGRMQLDRCVRRLAG